MIDPIFTTAHVTLYQGDALGVLRSLPDESVDCCVTSPPYWGLRDYRVVGQLGLEKTPDAYAAALVGVLGEVRRILRPTGTLWLNLGDSYAGGGRGSGGNGIKSPKQRTNMGAYFEGNTDFDHGLKTKDLVGIPWRVAFALQAAGWYLRSDIIWAKPNVMPESVTDRPTKAHEYIFLLTKRANYFFDAAAIAEPSLRAGELPGGCYADGADPNSRGSAEKGWRGDKPVPLNRNSRSVWTFATQGYPEAHFATFPRELPERCIKAGCPEGGTVLDPFAGSGTTLAVARDLGRKSIGIELNPAYVALIEKRCAQLALEMGA